jgi:hypothetical protein
MYYVVYIQVGERYFMTEEQTWTRLVKRAQRILGK